MATTKLKIATQYDYESQEKPGVDFPIDDPNSRSITNQSDKDTTDINLIMKRYEKTGQIIVNGTSRQPYYGDFTQVPDYLTLKTTIAKVEQAFAALPAEVRSRFENDPQQLIDFLDDEKNNAEAVQLGLREAPLENTAPPKYPAGAGTAPAEPPASPAK